MRPRAPLPLLLLLGGAAGSEWLEEPYPPVPPAAPVLGDPTHYTTVTFFNVAPCTTIQAVKFQFVDEQVRGPFRSFRHEHRFDDVAGVTTMTDSIDVDANYCT